MSFLLKVNLWLLCMYLMLFYKNTEPMCIITSGYDIHLYAKRNPGIKLTPLQDPVLFSCLSLQSGDNRMLEQHAFPTVLFSQKA